MNQLFNQMYEEEILAGKDEETAWQEAMKKLSEWAYNEVDEQFDPTLFNDTGDWMYRLR